MRPKITRKGLKKFFLRAGVFISCLAFFPLAFFVGGFYLKQHFYNKAHFDKVLQPREAPSISKSPEQIEGVVRG